MTSPTQAGATQSTFTEPFYTTRIDPTGSILTGFSDVNSWYNSMVLTLHRRMSHGLEFTLNYTLARPPTAGRCLDSSALSTEPTRRSILRTGSSSTRSPISIRGSASSAAWFGYRPMRRNFRIMAARLILDGFNFSTIVVVATGQPVTGILSGFPSGAPDGGLTGGLVNNSGTGTGGRAPNVPRNSFTGPGGANVDFRIGRQFAFHERFKLSLVGEAFNLFNFTNFYSVNNTSYNYSAAGSGACTGHTNGCLVANPQFFVPLTSNNNLSGARQLQISGRITF